MKHWEADLNGEKITYWRSIENRRRTEEYLRSVEDEFSEHASSLTSMDRRSMMKAMGASIALAGLGISCRRPEEKILPYVKEPRGVIPGIPNFFATAQPTPFGANGILVESQEGRPTKVEGNPDHPESLGKASIINQAAVLEIYDPDRSRFVMKEQGGDRLPVDWMDWDVFASKHFLELRKRNGKGFAILCDADISPTFLRLKERVRALYPEVSFYVHEPMRQGSAEAASSAAFGPHTRVRYHVEKAQVLLSLWNDPFSIGPEHLRHMRGYSKNRQVLEQSDIGTMSRHYAVEADYTLAGVNADHRLRLPVGLAVNFLTALTHELHTVHGLDIAEGIGGARSLRDLVSRPPSYRGIDKKFISVLAGDLMSNRGKALIMGGDILPWPALSLIHILNTSLLGYKKTFEVLKIDDPRATAHLLEKGIEDLAVELDSGGVNTLLIMGVNPAYDSPRVLGFSSLIKKAAISIHLGQWRDETGSECTWHLPATHFLEHFADTRSYDGHIAIVQPLIKPLFNARSNLQILGQIAEEPWREILPMVKKTFAERSVMDDGRFDKALHQGYVEGSAFKTMDDLRIDFGHVYGAFAKLVPRAPNKENLELILNFDRKVLDGRYGNHSWLQELPDPVTKMAWGNALLMSPVAARGYGIKSGVKKNAYVADVVKVMVEDVSVELPVFVMPGLSDYTVVTTLGYGRTAAGKIGDGVGVDNYKLLLDRSKRISHGVRIGLTGKTVEICSTQEQFAMDGDTVQQVEVLSLKGRDPARLTDVADYAKDPLRAKRASIPENLLVEEPGREQKVPLQITKPWDYSRGNQWGMVIDLAKCTGCNACVLACQSENNVPVVGKEQVIRGRMMHWIRVDRYFVGDVKDPKAISQPVPCQHCENAPCEPVCPVAATVHDREGLNVMTYNRCIGTRYCANNCPYKVRRFNYFDFSHSGNIYVEAETAKRQKTLEMQRNPDVTVRYRGVMEKCTYCTQRIQEAKMAARRAGRDQENLPDGAVVPACAQTCPSEAIVFGNINDKSSMVSKQKSSDRNYTMLDILNTRPRTSYLSLLKNPHPELVA